MDKKEFLYRAVSHDGRSLEIEETALKSLDIATLSPGEYHILHGNRVFNVRVESVDRDSKTFHLVVNGKDIHLTLRDRVQVMVDDLGFSTGGDKVSSDVIAPMPGTVLDIKVKAGENVARGSTLLILEAMKMENVITAAADGSVKEVHVEEGQAVGKGDLLLSFD